MVWELRVGNGDFRAELVLGICLPVLVVILVGDNHLALFRKFTHSYSCRGSRPQEGMPFSSAALLISSMGYWLVCWRNHVVRLHSLLQVAQAIVLEGQAQITPVLRVVVGSYLVLPLTP